MKISVCITGASGVIIGFNLLKELLSDNHTNTITCVNLVISQAGILTIKEELGVSLSSNPNQIKTLVTSHLSIQYPDKLFCYGISDWYSPMASGSSNIDTMVICPCSMSTLGKIAHGIGEDLITRAADVIMKERKNLILVPRETPLSVVHLENMTKLAKMNVSILPPMLEFYTHPKTIDDIINFNVSRILDQMNINNNLSPRWNTQQ